MAGITNRRGIFRTVAGLTVFVWLALSAGCSSSPDKPSIRSFTASPTTIASGNCAGLYADFTGGTGVIDQRIAIQPGSTVSVCPGRTRTYTLTVTNTSGDSSSRSVTVYVVPAPVITGFTAASELIIRGNSTTLTPEFAHGVGVIDNGIGTVVSGKAITVIPSVTTTYTLTVTDDITGEFVTSHVTIEVTSVLGTGSLNTGRIYHSATLLPTGKVLIAGGGQDWDSAALDSAELYDPATGTFSVGANLNAPRMEHTATLLPDGRVLIAGGRYASTPLSSAELYDPVTGAFTATGSMNTARSNHTATLLDNGTVLITGGWQGSIAGAELYDPASATFTTAGDMTIDRFSHTATLLPNGEVLIAGGYSTSTSSPLATAELYDPAEKRFTPAGSMNSRRWNASATRLSNGQVLIIGGIPDSLYGSELYDPSAGFSVTANRIYGGGYVSEGILLDNGKVFTAGGNSTAIELYDRTTESYSKGGDLSAATQAFSVTLLPDGNVLIAGGWWNAVVTATAEIYYP